MATTRKNTDPSNWMGTNVALLTNRKKVHGIFGRTTIRQGKAHTRKHGFYGVYVNKKDEPTREPDSWWFGNKLNGGQTDLRAYWIDEDKVKQPDSRKVDKCVGSHKRKYRNGICRRRNGTMYIKSKQVFDTWAGKVMTEY